MTKLIGAVLFVAGVIVGSVNAHFIWPALAQGSIPPLYGIVVSSCGAASYSTTQIMAPWTQDTTGKLCIN